MTFWILEAVYGTDGYYGEISTYIPIGTCSEKEAVKKSKERLESTFYKGYNRHYLTAYNELGKKIKEITIELKERR